MSDHNSQTIVANDAKYVSFHEAGHAAATYLVGGTVEEIVLNAGDEPSDRARASLTEAGKRTIAAAGCAVEYLLYSKHRLVDESGAAISEKAFINRAMASAHHDKISFFGRDHETSDGTWPSELDEAFIKFAITEVAPKLEPLLSEIETLAKSLLAQKKLSQAQVENILGLAGTVDVRQREYGIAKKISPSSRLHTGNIGSCIALFGRDDKNGLAFMGHFDQVHVVFGGVRKIVDELTRSGYDPRTFKVFAAGGVLPWWPISYFVIALVSALTLNVGLGLRCLFAIASIVAGLYCGATLPLTLWYWRRTTGVKVDFLWYKTCLPWRKTEAIVDTHAGPPYLVRLERSRWLPVAGTLMRLTLGAADRSADLTHLPFRSTRRTNSRRY